MEKKTAEQILLQFPSNREYPCYYHESNVIDAMEEYASQYLTDSAPSSTLEWVKASDNLPDRASHYNCEFLGVPTVFWIDKKNESIVNRNGDLIDKSIWDKIKWLSESTPSTSTDAGQLFTREQMEDEFIKSQIQEVSKLYEMVKDHPVMGANMKSRLDQLKASLCTQPVSEGKEEKK